MTKRMLIDATHAEETRVVVLDGNRLEDFDVETSTKKQIKGNIYLAKIVRVEPSLQAAFVEYGGGRHGFLAFDEIHPDYYQIPVADRQRLLAMEAEEARREQEEEDRAATRAAAAEPPAGPIAAEAAEPADMAPDMVPWAPPAGADSPEAAFAPEPADLAEPGAPPAFADAPAPHAREIPIAPESPPGSPPGSPPAHDAWDTPIPATEAEADAEPGDTIAPRAQPLPMTAEVRHGRPLDDAEADADADDQLPEEPPPETIGGEHDTADEPRLRRAPDRFMRSYKIQEVIHRRQIMLVQVEKEERGTKGAALTTFISLAGRYSVLMPNSPRGGGVSRKITAPADRRRLKEVMAELELPAGMGLIVRTAGANRPKPEIKRDAEYLLRLWDDIRERTLSSVAPALIHEEASLIKRAIRDVYSRDIDEIAVDGEEGWRAARDFMRMLMPAQARKVQLWRDPASPAGTAGQPLFARHGVEAQLDSMLSPNVQLRSGGYLVINQAEALVAIDVNSGRSTRERGIEETALRTNLEAAEEVARQLRLRDLAGLIVIDFIDMESRKHNGMVEKRLKEALKSDRARIQLGHISHFGLLEMSRQRLRPSLAETSLVVCAHCGGAGHVRSTESAAIHVLRAIEEEGGKRRAGEIMVHAASPIVLYILNHKRVLLTEIEARHGLHVRFATDETLIPPAIRIEKLRSYVAPEPAAAPQAAPAADEEAWSEPAETEGEIAAEADEPDTEVVAAQEPADGEAEASRRRRRRRRRGGRREDAAGAQESGEPGAAEAAEAQPAAQPAASETVAIATSEFAPDEAGQHVEGVPEHAEPDADGADPRGRRRSRRGGRRRRREGEPQTQPIAPDAEQPDLPTVYVGPTPANPFGGEMFDIFDVMEQAEARASAEAASRPVPQPAEPAIATPEPAAEAEAAPPPPEPAASVQVVMEPAAEPEPPPAIQPILVGAADEAPVAKKRGWWHRGG